MAHMAHMARLPAAAGRAVAGRLPRGIVDMGGGVLAMTKLLREPPTHIKRKMEL